MAGLRRKGKGITGRVEEDRQATVRWVLVGGREKVLVTDRGGTGTKVSEMKREERITDIREKERCFGFKGG